MAYNIHQKLADNIAAIKLALEWDGTAALSEDDRAALSKYAGFGGIKPILYPESDREDWLKHGATTDDLRLHAPMMELHRLLHKHFDEAQYKEVIQSLKNSVLTAFYTPAVVPQILYNVLQENNIHPKRLYEPSSGAGIFINEAVKSFDSLEQITAVEKDVLTGKILTALNSATGVPIDTQVKGFEETTTEDNGKYDLVASNIPFGNFTVYDPALPEHVTGKIHNYFFAKGLEKIGNGGILAYITTDAFLNTPSNKEAREYLFNRADFISASVMPDNLMKDTGNTEAPSHLLVVQKNDAKENLSADEQLLTGVVEKQNEFGKYFLNQYIDSHPETITGDEIKPGKNQYGHAHQTVWQKGDINAIGERLYNTIDEGVKARFNREAFEQAIRPVKKQFTFLPMPENMPDNTTVQLGLFDAVPVENINRAFAYLTNKDTLAVQKKTARVISKIKTDENPAHESIVLLTAKNYSKDSRYLYKLYSNIKEVSVPDYWMAAHSLNDELKALSKALQQFPYQYRYEGDANLKSQFALEQRTPEYFTGLKPFYKEGTVVIHNGEAGTIGKPEKDFSRALFTPFTITKEHTAFYQSYVVVRDSYVTLAQAEARDEEAFPALRETLNQAYDGFTSSYGQLNKGENRKLILNDSAFGFITLSSLERKQGEQYVMADILSQPLFQQKEAFRTDDPLEALAVSLNEKGKVDIPFISAATGLPAFEAIDRLGSHVYLNPATQAWETTDQYLSGNVVAKLRLAKEAAEQNPDNAQIQRSLAAITKVQPERIPFELLDFNLGERWVPTDYYERFAKHLFELDTSVHYFSSLDTFKVQVTGSNAKVNREYAITPKNNRTMYGYTLMEHALEKYPTVQVHLIDNFCGV